MVVVTCVATWAVTKADDFSYDRDDIEHGPHAWMHDCIGFRQSPIDIRFSQLAGQRSSSIRYRYSSPKVKGELKNNGHTAVFKLDTKSYTLTGVPFHTGDTYVLKQIHFHFGRGNDEGSEHRLNGRKFPGEVHLVNFNRKYGDIGEAIKHSDGLAVVGVFIQATGGEDERDKRDNQNEGRNRGFAADIDAFLQKGLPKIKEKGDDIEHVSMKPISLLPRSNALFYYEGSLTTPPCSEVVTWIVFRDPISLSQQTFNLFRNLKDSHGYPIGKFGNFRPVQEQNWRDIFISTSSSSD